MRFRVNDSGKKVNPDFVPPSNKVQVKPLSRPSNKPLSPFERNELEKAMLGRGVEYETIQLILSDFDARIEHLRNLWRTIDEW